LVGSNVVKYYKMVSIGDPLSSFGVILNFALLHYPKSVLFLWCEIVAFYPFTL